MHVIYFIPGLGLDERFFSKLQLDGYEKRYIKWIPPLKNESLVSYAQRLISQIDSKKNFTLIGASFGGMLAVEISKLLQPQYLILIASVKSYDEIPFFMRFFKYLPIYKLLTESFIRWLARIHKHRFGIYTDADLQLLEDMLLACPNQYLKRTIDMVVNWTNTNYPREVIHIHGDADHEFPISKIKNPIVVKGAAHFMPYHNADEVEKIILEQLTISK